MDYKIIIRRHIKAKLMKLKVDPIKKVPILTVPKRCSQRMIDGFLRESEGWLNSELIKYVPNNGDLPSTVSFKGVDYNLSFTPCQKKSYVIKDEEKKQLLIYGSTLTQKLTLVKFLKKAALEEATLYLQKYQRVLGIKINRIGIKDYKSRWGCCYKRGDIFLSWRLIMAPSQVFEYVCAHEAAHLIHPNHSPYFWHLVASLFPSWKTSYRWLKHYGSTLFHEI